MIRHGESPFLECSSKGDKRFSAFHAKVNGRSIEELYQARKEFSDGSTGLSPKEAKGKKATNMHTCALYYAYLWDTYIAEHPELHDTLLNASGTSDIFGKDNCQCQASELWRIKNGWLKLMKKGND